MPEPLAARPSRGSSLPAQLTHFVGRSRELDALVPLLATTRLLTLTGAGGSGKTRLAAEVAARVEGRFAETMWVDLAAVSDSGLVANQVSVATGSPERPNASVLDGLLEALAGRPVLLVLDNCEHVVDAAADLVDRLLRGLPELLVLATSRAALGVPGEIAWLVPPLAAAEAVQLFVERAQAVLPAFALTPGNAAAVAEICRRLDGIPLAIELAAARVRALTPEQIAERLSDAFRLLSGGSRTVLPRHRTLRGTMEWSYGLLSPRERILLRRLAVFVGSFTLEAAERIATGEPLEEEDILDGISALVDQSMVVMESGEGEARYHLLETVRQYGQELLRDADEIETQRARHAAYFLEFAERAEPHLFAGAGSLAWNSRVKAESGNLRAAMLWSEEDPSRVQVALRIGAAIHWLWFATGQFSEGRQRLAAALERSAEAPPLVRGQALIALSMTAFWQGDQAAVLAPAEAALPLLRESGNDLQVAYALTALGAALDVAGAPTEAMVRLSEALEIVRRGPRHVMLGFALYWYGRAALDAGDRAAARSAFEEAVGLGRELEHRPGIAHPLTMAARVAFLEERHDDAALQYAESAALHHETEEGWGLANALEGMAAVAVATGRPERGVRLMAAAETVRERIASALTPTERRDRDRHLEAARKVLGSRFAEVWAAGRALSTAEAVEQACQIPRGITGEHPIPVVETRPAPAPAPAPADLRVLALGPLQVFRGTEAVESTAWGSARPRELLVFLLLGRNGRSKEEVGVALWPEASAAQLRNSFHVTLHRLRKALGNPDWIGQSNERYQVDPALGVEFDVARFERETAEARQALSKRTAGAVAALERALAWYRGDFLDGEPVGDWHQEHRDHLRLMFAESGMALGAAHLDQDRPAKAAEVFRRVLVRDELREEAWRGLMISSARLGERSQAARLYQQLVTVLAQELDAEPDPETTELHHRIQSGGTV